MAGGVIFANSLACQVKSSGPVNENHTYSDSLGCRDVIGTTYTFPTPTKAPGGRYENGSVLAVFGPCLSHGWGFM